MDSAALVRSHSNLDGDSNFGGWIAVDQRNAYGAAVDRHGGRDVDNRNVAATSRKVGGAHNSPQCVARQHFLSTTLSHSR